MQPPTSIPPELKELTPKEHYMSLGLMILFILLGMIGCYMVGVNVAQHYKVSCHYMWCEVVGKK